MLKKGVLFVFFAFVLSSCSYNFVGSYSGLVGGVSKIYISEVKNLTNEPNLQTYLKGYLINELNLDSRVSVVKKQNADGILSVKITSYDISPSSFSASGLTSMYRCTIVVSVSLKGEKGYLIKDKSLSAYRDYNAQDAVSATEEARLSIAKQVLKDLALKIDNELFVNF